MPLYTEVDENNLDSWIDALPERSNLLQLPLTHYPYPSWHPEYDLQFKDATTPLAPEQTAELYTLQVQLIDTFHQAIRNKNTEVVALLIKSGYVSPDVPDAAGATPLIAAIDAGNGAMVCTLVGLGATVNGYGRYSDAERTPIMVAAQLGRLALVKLLREDFEADDGIIAPDGQLALRLAADAGHREVVAYLPARRGGAWRRWKTHHDVAVRRIRDAGRNIYIFFKFFLYDVPRFFVWSCPKHVIVLPVYRSGKWCWENRKRFGGWCKRQATEFPGRVQRAGKAVWRGAKKVPKAVWKVAREVPQAVWKVAKEIPGILKRMMEAVWRFIKRIPGVMKMVCVWIWDTLKAAGVAVADVFLKVVSAIHTAVMAVLDFFRSIKLQDVWNGICEVFRAIFIKMPQMVWEGIKAAGNLTKKILVGLFGCIGLLIWYFFKGLIWIAQYVPSQLWRIICGIGSSMAKGYHEVMVWFNPKH